MSWQVGDLALCVNDDPCPVYGPTPYRSGRIYTVSEVRTGTDKNTGASGTGLRTKEFPSGQWRVSWSFRKIKPDEHEACEPEFVVLLNRTKRTVEAELGAIASHEAPAGLRRPGFDQLSQGDVL